MRTKLDAEQERPVPAAQSGEGGPDKLKVKRDRAGRESEGFIVPKGRRSLPVAGESRWREGTLLWLWARLEQVRQILSGLRLELHPTKTRLVELGLGKEGFDPGGRACRK